MAAKKNNITTKKQAQTKTKRTSKKTNNQPKKNYTTMVLLLIILVLLGIIAYTYRDKLEVFYKTTVSYINSKNSPKENLNEKKPSSKNNDLKSSINKIDNKIEKNQKQTTTVQQEKFKKVSTTTTTTTTIKKDPKTATTLKQISTTTTTIKKVVPVTTTTTVLQESRVKQTKIYLTKISDEKLFPFVATRNVDYKDAPLTETIACLLKGPTKIEEDNDVVTNIPNGTRLLSAWVKGSIAYLNFSSEFENNHFGKESTMYQLYQIVFTATEFKGVKSVQILINGQKQDYLGGEGIIIGSPLNRSSF